VLVVIDEAQAFGIDLRQLVYGVLKPAVADYRGTIVLTGTPGNLIKGLFFDVTNGREAGWSGHRWTTYDNPYMAEQWAGEIADLKAGGADARQDVSRAEEGEVDRGVPAAGRHVVAQRRQAGGQHHGGGPGPGHLRPVPGGAVAASVRGAAQRPRMAHQGVDHEGGKAAPRQPVGKGQPAQDAHQPGLPGQGELPRGDLRR